MNHRIIQALCVASLTLGATSCNDFLDVQPKGELTQDVQFQRTQGYYDAMYGVYGTMAAKKLYGENLSYGFLDKIGQMFGYLNTTNNDTEILNYDYTNNTVRSTIDNIWTSQYQAISYVNNVLGNLDQLNSSDESLRLVRGEAYGLRAFLHFDLLRLYCPDYRQQPEAQYGLPYSDAFNLENKTVYTLKGTYERILGDLDKAEEYLHNDTTMAAVEGRESEYDYNRPRQFNLYAVYATKARVYWSMGDYTKAADYARRVINAKRNFALAASTQFNDVRRFPVKGEMIFGLYNNGLSQSIYNTFFGTVQASGNFTEARQDLDKVYETSSFASDNTDVRFAAFYRQNGSTFTFQRLINSEGEIKNAPVEGVTLLRLPEMYYILAESIYDTDKAGALAALNAVRTSRGLKALAADDAKLLNRESFEKELMAERMREMPGEGQVFFSLKHFNRSFTDIRGRKTIQPEERIFVLPRPERELEFGNKQQ